MVKKRYVILDALRGFAILGIILANFPEFSLWTFSDPSTWTGTDRIIRALQTMFVDGKFYTLFSLLFGMGFSILWLKYFKFGPVEWVWRMLTYGKWLPLRQKESV